MEAVKLSAPTADSPGTLANEDRNLNDTGDDTHPKPAASTSSKKTSARQYFRNPETELFCIKLPLTNGPLTVYDVKQFVHREYASKLAEYIPGNCVRCNGKTKSNLVGSVCNACQPKVQMSVRACRTANNLSYKPKKKSNQLTGTERPAVVSESNMEQARQFLEHLFLHGPADHAT